MKIVYCIPATYNSAGMERVLARKVNYLADKCGHDIYIVTTCQKGRPSFYKMAGSVKYIDLGIDYETMAELPIFKRIIAKKKASRLHKSKLEKVLKDLKPDITVSMYTHEMKFLPEIKDGSKKVLELHFSKNFRSLDANANNKSKLLKIIGNVLDKQERKRIKQYDKFVVLSNRDAKDWGNKYRNIEVISNPSTFEPEYVADSKAKKVVAIGRLCKQKGFDMLIDAWVKINPEIRNGWSLDIVGSGPDKQELEQQIENADVADSIFIKAPVKDVTKLYASHSIFAFPSRYEGLGMTLMEAMSLGLCSVSFDCPCGPSEMIVDDSKGALVRQNDVKGFSDKLAYYMQNPEKRMECGINASKYIKDIFSESVIMSKWEFLFNSVVDSRTV